MYQKEDEGKDYTTKMFKALVNAYLDSFEYERKIYIPKTLNLLFKAENVYASKWTKDSSPLYEFSENNKDAIKKAYKKCQ